MKKFFFFTAITFLTLSSCKKEATTSLDEQSPRIKSNSTNNLVHAVPIRYKETSVLVGEQWNPCSQEYIDSKGTLYTEIRGVISNNKIPYV